jgi:hypothetical protein
LTTNTNDLTTSLKLRFHGWQNNQRITRIARQVSEHARPDPQAEPVIVFNASSRLTGLSLNAAFTLLTAWSLRLAGVPVVQFVCHSGMSHCVLGTNRQDYHDPPPCHSCITQSQRLWAGTETRWFGYQEDARLASAINGLTIAELSVFAYPASFLPGGNHNRNIPLGKLVLPSIRWALRRHNLPEDGDTRYLLRSYMLSAFSIASQFAELITELNPPTAIIFNGIMYPEASALWVTENMGVRVITHEVGFQHLTTFFTEGQATAYPVEIPGDFELTEQQDKRLDAYLEKRFQGDFTMAGIPFWPEMSPLDDAFLDKAGKFKQIVPVFTNVVYDTSQVHANTIFPHMFAWLEVILDIVHKHPETLFIIRAHPDEMRPGTAKLSNESVEQWVVANRIEELPNVLFINPQQYISSYELIQQSRFVLVYNSSIGLEAALLGKVVVCGGKARYTRYPTVIFPQSEDELRREIEALLNADEVIVPQVFQRNARKFLYYQLYRTSLPLEEFLETIPRKGYVQLKSFSWDRLHPENSPTMGIIYDGIINGGPFLRKEE